MTRDEIKAICEKARLHIEKYGIGTRPITAYQRARFEKLIKLNGERNRGSIAMNEMIERVAKAKWARRQEVARRAGIKPPLLDWDDEFEGLREEVRSETRAAIEAMREPTAGMIEAGREQTCEHGDIQCGADEAWRAMIDAALQRS